MIKKIFSALVVVLFATYVMAQTGLTCNDPIPVDKNFVGEVPRAGEYWFTAWTYDLPLTVFFLPNSDDCPFGPEVEVDFTCTPGIYDDPQLDKVINGVSSLGFSLPVEFLCEQVLSGNKIAYKLNIGQFYRNQLAEAGITYNVQAFVKVNFPEGGQVTLKPDTAFRNCMESSQMVALGDTLDILANDSNSVFLLPYSEWKNDSIQFIWIGDGNAQVWLATTDCEFTPIIESGYVCDKYDVNNIEPYKIQSSQIKETIDKYADGGGVYFTKVIAPVNGKLVVEKIPLKKPQGGAILLEYEKTVTVAANDTNTLYCFPRTWGSTKLIAATIFPVTMYSALSPNFSASKEDARIFGFYPFLNYGSTKAIFFSESELKNFFSETQDDYVYVRFACAESMSITPKEWEASSCANESMQIVPNQTFAVKAKSSSVLYRLQYEQWEGYSITLSWTGNSTLPSYVASACNFELSSSSPSVLYSTTVKRKGSVEIGQSEVNSWVDGIDADGFLYVRFNPTNQGKITFKTNKPEPVVPVSPCVTNSTELKLNSIVSLDLSSVHTIYRINYAEWQAAGATLAWEGTSPLHTFLAGTCTFPVAPHNRYVLDYEAVLPAGEKVMAADWLARMAQYVDEDGYLYIRFLTEFEGELTVK